MTKFRVGDITTFKYDDELYYIVKIETEEVTFSLWCYPITNSINGLNYHNILYTDIFRESTQLYELNKGNILLQIW